MNGNDVVERLFRKFKDRDENHWTRSGYSQCAVAIYGVEDRIYVCMVQSGAKPMTEEECSGCSGGHVDAAKMAERLQWSGEKQ